MNCTTGKELFSTKYLSGFHKFADTHNFIKPNDKQALDLMTASARAVLAKFPEAFLAYGDSDEYSFVFKKSTSLYNRRSAKITTTLVSHFAAAYVQKWPEYFSDKQLELIPSFDARAVLYPTDQNLRDYLSWRQVDCHVNNLYNTVFWALVLKGGLSNRDAQERLKGTLSGDKNEILFSEFGINYNNEPEQFRKGTTLYKVKVDIPIEDQVASKGAEVKSRTQIKETTNDIIGETFWQENPHLLSS